MKIKNWLPAIAITLCLALLLAACTKKPSSGDTSASGAAEQPRRVKPFSDMTYTRPDTANLSTQLTGLAQTVQQANSFDKAMEAVQKSDALLDDFNTMYRLAQIHSWLGTDDAFYSDELSFLDGQASAIQQAAAQVTTNLLEGPYAGEYRGRNGSFLFDAQRTRLIFDGAAMDAYRKQRQTLVDQYRTMIDTLTVEYEGTAYTWEQLKTVESANLHRELLGSYYQQHLVDFTNLYAQLVALDGDTAYNLGFESAEEMFYVQYGRSYYTTEMEPLLNHVAETFAPVAAAISPVTYQPDYISPEDMLAALPAELEKINPALAEAFTGMKDNALYAIAKEGQPTRQAVVTLPAYDAPYLYWQPGSTPVSRLLQGYGAFNYYWQHFNQKVPPATDTLEFFSQGMEQLLAGSWGTFSQSPAEATLYGLQHSLMDNLVWPCLLEEFQIKLYQLDSFDSSILGTLYASLLQKYGLGAKVVGDMYGGDNSWIGNETLFATPFYTAGVAAGFLGARQVAMDSGAERYLAALGQNQYQTYTQLLEASGLRPFTDTGLLQDIASGYGDAFGLDAAALSATPSTSIAESTPDETSTSLPQKETPSSEESSSTASGSEARMG